MKPTINSVLLATLLLGCGGPVHESLGPPPTNKFSPDIGKPDEPPNQEVTFSQVKRIIDKYSCTNCHKPENAKHGVDLTAIEKVMSAPRLVVVGRPEDSNLYRIVKADKMPRRPPFLTNEEKDLIFKWILGGADPK